MELIFFKYQATGNDFVIFDGRITQPDTSAEFLSLICHRRFGVGADGVIIVSEDPDSDFRVDYYNPDGSQSLCGNGTRAAVLFARHMGFVDKDKMEFSAYDGMHQAQILGDGNIRLKMSDVADFQISSKGVFVDTGSPHLVRFVESVSEVNIMTEGSKWRHDEAFENGTNVNFVEKLDLNKLKVRTFERGVECETLSCGTGVTATALAAALQGISSPVNIEAEGGNLKVEFMKNGNSSFSEIYLIGPAAKVFEGKYMTD